MRITLKQMAVFDAVARLGSVSKASQELALSQSAVSMALADLESQLAKPLFSRLHRRLLLNEDGRRLQPQIRSVLLGARDVERWSNAAPIEGTIRVGASSSIGNLLLPPVCAQFLRTHPGVQLSLIVLPTSDVVRQVDDLTLDLAFIETPTIRATLKMVRWLEDPLTVICGASHRLAGRRRIQPRDLESETWYLQQQSSITRTAFTRVILQHVNSIRIGLETNSIETIKRAVAEGLGLGCLSRRYVEEELQKGRLCALNVRGVEITRTLSIVSRKDVRQGAVSEEFVQAAIDYYAPRSSRKSTAPADD